MGVTPDQDRQTNIAEQGQYLGVPQWGTFGSRRLVSAVLDCSRIAEARRDYRHPIGIVEDIRLNPQP